MEREGSPLRSRLPVLNQINRIHTLLSYAFRVYVNRFPTYAKVFLDAFP